MTEVTRTFDGGTPGNNCASGANDVEVVQQGTPKFDAGFHGAAGIVCGTSSNTADTRIRVDLGISGDHYGSVYCKNDTAHGHGSSSVFFFRLVSSGNAFLMEMRARPGNALSIRVAAVEVRAGTAGEIPVNQTFRLDWYKHGTSFDWRIYYDPEDVSGTPDLSGTITPDTQTPSRVIIGADSSAAITKHWTFDTVRARDTGGWYSAFNPPAANPVTVWNGTSEVAGTVTVWNGSSEVAVSDVEVAP